jgi:hypothetical protein
MFRVKVGVLSKFERLGVGGGHIRMYLKETGVNTRIWLIGLGIGKMNVRPAVGWRVLALNCMTCLFICFDPICGDVQVKSPVRVELCTIHSRHVTSLTCGYMPCPSQSSRPYRPDYYKL